MCRPSTGVSSRPADALRRRTWLKGRLMRARLVAAGIAVLVLARSAAQALWLGVPDFPRIVQEADVCVCGRITSARELREGVDRGHDSYECVAELLVDHVVFGPCREREHIAVFYGEGMVDRGAARARDPDRDERRPGRDQVREETCQQDPVQARGAQARAAVVGGLVAGEERALSAGPGRVARDRRVRP